MGTNMQRQWSIFNICTCVSAPQGSSTWGRLLIECWLPHSTSLPSWPTLTPASPKTQQWGTRTTVSGGSSERSVMFGSSWFSLNSLCCLLCSGNLFVVQWDKVRLKDREAEGPFTFQAALHRNGTIVFNYRDVSYGFQLNCFLHHLYSFIYTVHERIFHLRGETILITLPLFFRSLYQWWKSIPPSIPWRWDCLMLSWHSSPPHSSQVSSLKNVHTWL